jgi:hypothetical protein
MPIFTRLGLESDCTFDFESNPDPTIYTEVVVNTSTKAAPSTPTEES